MPDELSGQTVTIKVQFDLAPVETTNEGIYIAGACQSPKDIPDSVAQAGGAAAAALSLIDQGVIYLDPSIAEVNKNLCAGCGQCAESCPYGAIAIEDGFAQVNAFLCKGCGTCSAACPNKAMSLMHFDDRQIVNEVIGVLNDMGDAFAVQEPFVEVQP